jgi:hypothetical protein
MAAQLASLALQFKMAKRRTNIGENKMTGAFIEKEIDFALPLQYRDEKHIGGVTKLEEWIKIIMSLHEKNNMGDMSTQEAQVEFLIILAKQETMFASYYTGKRIGEGLMAPGS